MCASSIAQRHRGQPHRLRISGLRTASSKSSGALSYPIRRLKGLSPAVAVEWAAVTAESNSSDTSIPAKTLAIL